MYFIRHALNQENSKGYNENVGIWVPDSANAEGEDNAVIVTEEAYF